MDQNEFLQQCHAITQRSIAQWAALQAEGKAQREVESREDLRWAYAEQVEKLGTERAVNRFNREKARHEEALVNIAGPGAAAVPLAATGGIQAAMDVEYMSHRSRIADLLREHCELMATSLRVSRLTRMDKIIHLRDNVAPNAQDYHTGFVIGENMLIEDKRIKNASAFYKLWREEKYNQLRDQAYFQQVKSAIVHPNPSKWPGLAAQVHEDSIRLQAAPRPRRPYRDWPDAQDASQRLAAAQRIPSMRASLAAAGFEFEKFLGVGGHGLAALFKCLGRDGQTRRMVIKMDLAPTTPPAKSMLLDEKEKLTKLTGRMHIVQRVSLGSLRTNMLVPDPATQSLDDSDEILVLEFMEGGDVHKLICKLVQLNVDLNSQILWQIFKCLFKGCVAMAWLDQNMPQRDGEVVSETAAGLAGDADEQADFTDPSSRALIHFDIDPQNIFIGKGYPNSSEHDSLPIFKIADFGIAEIVDRDNIKDAWHFRHRGKLDFLTPEQFCKEWDYIYEAPFHERRHDPKNNLYSTAGRYNKYHNLYQAALVMWCLITKVHLPPPILEMIHDRDGTVLYTYGSELMGPQYSHIDIDLREALCHCLAHDPDSRPSFEGLENFIHKKTDPDHWDKKMKDETEVLRKTLFGNLIPAGSRPTPGSATQQQPVTHLRQMHHNARAPLSVIPPTMQARRPVPTQTPMLARRPPPIRTHMPARRPLATAPSGLSRPLPIAPPTTAPRPLRPISGGVSRQRLGNGVFLQTEIGRTRATAPATRAVGAVGQAIGIAGSQAMNQQPPAQFYGLNYDGQNVQAPPVRTSTRTRVKRRLVRQWDRFVDKLKDNL